MRSTFSWILVVLLALAFVVVVGRQHAALAAVRVDLARARAESQREHSPSRPGRMPTAASAASADPALVAAQAEVASLRTQVEQAGRAASKQDTSPEEILAIGRICAASEWRNVGNATPQAALESVLWAGAGGDTRALAQMFAFVDDGTRHAAQALLERLPPQVRAQWSSPEQAVAFLSIQDMPTDSVQVRHFKNLDGWATPAAAVQLMLTTADQKPKNTTLLFTNSGDGWKLLVSIDVVKNYLALSHEPATSSPPK